MFAGVSVRLGGAIHQRSRIAIVAIMVGGLAQAGCSTSVVTVAIGHGSPNDTIGQTGFGKVTVQQVGKGAVIAWGMYVDPNYKVGTQFVVKVYAKIDAKNQNYEPHGSVNAQRAAKYPGKTLEIAGTGQPGRDTLFFDSKCCIA